MRVWVRVRVRARARVWVWVWVRVRVRVRARVRADPNPNPNLKRPSPPLLIDCTIRRMRTSTPLSAAFSASAMLYSYGMSVPG